MSIFEIVLTGVALSMDAAAVSMTNAMIHRSRLLRLLEMAFWFGFFQGVMPVLGFFVGNAFHDVISFMGDFLVALIFCFIGVKMIQDGLAQSEEAAGAKSLGHSLLLIQAFATSIDAFAVGVGFAASGSDISLAAPLIGVTTLIISLAAVAVGRFFGNILGKKAELLGGALLIFLGIKAFY